MGMAVKRIAVVAGLCLMAFVVTDVSAADNPKRKSGLWEIRSQMKGMADMGPVLECVDKNTDNLTKQDSADPDCKPPIIKRSGDRISVYSECKVTDTLTMGIDYQLQGSLDSAYKAVVKTITKTPQGTNTSVINMNARYLGPCKPGQKPGDVITP